MQFVDTHCHIHFSDYELDSDEVLRTANDAGVEKVLCVGCTLKDSIDGVNFAQGREHVWAAIGLHPHEASEYIRDSHALQQFRQLADRPKVVAIGETGLDYFYNHAPKEDQKHMLRFQLSLAQEFSLPVIFHVREAFDDFFPIYDEFSGLQGVVHSFTGTMQELDKILHRGLYIGLNGIMTFTQDKKQLEMAASVPLERLLLETDAPFLTPKPFRGKICEPKHVRVTGEFLSNMRGETLAKLAAQTSKNAHKLFKLS